MTSSISGASLARQNSMPLPEKTQHGTPKVSQDDANHQATKAKLEQKVPQLKTSLEKELAHHWRYDRTVNQNQITGSSYSDQRREALSKIPGAADIAAQYGVTFSVADKPALDFVSKLNIRNEADSDYLRDSPSIDYKETCRKIYKQQTKSSQALPAAFVNSPHAAAKILEHFSGSPSIPSAQSHLRHHLKQLGNGLYALEFRNSADVAKSEAYIGLYGARPSAYAVISAAAGGAQAIPDDPSIDNHKYMEKLSSVTDSPTERLRAIPKDHPLAAMSRTSADLIELLTDVFEERGVMEEHAHNPALASGLQGLSKIADTLPSLTHDSALFGNGYQLAMEELQVCLSAAPPYNMEDFRIAASPLTASHCLPSNVPEPKVHLVSSGMGAISLGFELANILTGSPDVGEARTEKYGKSPDYFEVSKLRHHRDIHSSGSPNAVYATLNPSLPTGDKKHEQWGVDAVIDSIQTRLEQNKKTGNKEPLTMILDATLEKPGDMEKLVSTLSSDIGKGNVRIVACKSYQKYANLCSAKVMAGGITLISADDAAAKAANQHLDRVEENLNLIANSDSQLMIHMLGCHDQEFSLLNKAKDNAKFVAENFFTGEDGHVELKRYDNDLPFLTFDHPNEPSYMDLMTASGGMSKKVEIGGHISESSMPSRDSFAFSHTNPCLIAQGTNKQVRLAFGQESKAELTELFYMPSLAMHANKHWSCGQALKLVQQLADEGIQSVKVPPHVKPTLFQKLHIIGRLEQPEINDQTRLTAEPSELRTQQQQNDTAGLTMHKIVSVAAHLSELIQHLTEPEDWQTGPDRALVDTLTKGLIQSGLPRVSNYGKSSVLSLQAFMCNADMLTDSPTLQQLGLKRLADACQNLPGVPGSGEHLLSVPDAVFNDAKHIDQDHLLDAIFDPLDKQTQVDIIQKMTDKGDFIKAQACVDRMEGKMMQSTSNTPDNLLPTGNRTQGQTSLSMASQLAKIKQQLQN